VIDDGVVGVVDRASSDRACTVEGVSGRVVVGMTACAVLESG
jgi:hypothetical protein